MTPRNAAAAACLLIGLAACGGPASPAEPAPRPEAPEEAPGTDPGEPVGRPVDTETEPPVRDTAAGTAEEEEVVAEPDEASEPEPEPAPPPARRRAVNRVPVPVLPGAVLPRRRIVAFYGNPASTRMGILGEVPPDEMLRRLDREVAAWQNADPDTPVQPALHLIAVMAAGDPGPDSLYRIRMPERRIEQVMDWAERRDAIVFLDIQPGRSSVRAELPRLQHWLTRPDVHLALDPEWAMPSNALPGKQIGTMSAGDVNYAIGFLADLVERHRLPPKVLVVHRFTQSMLTNAMDIRIDPRVQVVVNMDGWGPPAQKIHSYRDIVAPEAEQFTGFKLFFHNDRRGGSRLLTPDEILALDPPPIYIQYQ